MSKPTLTQALAILNILEQNGISEMKLGDLLDTKLLEDLLEGWAHGLDRLEFRQKLLLPTPFLYAGRPERICDHSGDKPLTTVLREAAIDITDYRERPLEPVIYRNPEAIIRPIWFEEPGQAKDLVEEAKNYGWELGDSFDAVQYYRATYGSTETAIATLIAPATRSARALESIHWFAIEVPKSRAFWWDTDNLHTVHGNGIKFLLRKGLPV